MRPGSPLRLQPFPPTETAPALNTRHRPANRCPRSAPNSEVNVGRSAPPVHHRQPLRCHRRPGRPRRGSSRPGRKAHTAATTAPRRAAKDARTASTRRPPRSYSAPACHHRLRRRPRGLPCRPIPGLRATTLADPLIAATPTHTRLRRASFPSAIPSPRKTIGGETTPRSILRETAPKATSASANDARTESSIDDPEECSWVGKLGWPVYPALVDPSSAAARLDIATAPWRTTWWPPAARTVATRRTPPRFSSPSPIGGPGFPTGREKGPRGRPRLSER